MDQLCGTSSGRQEQLYLHDLQQQQQQPMQANGAATRRPGSTLPRSSSAPSWPPALLAGGSGEGPGGTSRIRIGVCAMERKARSRPMREILRRLLACNEFEVVEFEDQTILHEDVSCWPVVDCLLSWHSEGFPLEKAQSYVQLVQPFCVNDLGAQEVLLDRRRVYRVLQESSIPVPRHVVVSRDGLAPGESPPGFVEGEDFVEVDGVRINKPFVEKPASGEDHNIWVYYPQSMGGGVKRLFRKVADRSGNYDPAHSGAVRRDGSYIYEEFLATGGTDVKVYTVGPRYAHAEARKSPVVDGRVARTADGKEVRFPVLLSPQEKEIARMVCLAFGQKVCGFDLLRSERGGSYVCDVNGWSFVKGSTKYYEDAADILRSIILQALAPHRLHLLPALPQAPTFGLMRESQRVLAAAGAAPCDDDMQGGPDRTNSLLAPPPAILPPPPAAGGSPDDAAAAAAAAATAAAVAGGGGLPGEELRCVLAVVRHGDRTPKQKVKVAVTHPAFLALYERHADRHKAPGPSRQAKLKSAAQLQELLDVTRQVLTTPHQQQQHQQLEQQQHQHQHQHQQAATTSPSPAPAAASEAAGATGNHPNHPNGQPLDPEAVASLAVVRSVLEAGGHFSGINRKAQLKPRGWEPPKAGTPGAAGAEVSKSGGRLSSLLLIVKWGGVLTHAGRAQAETLGVRFRTSMYPRAGPAGGGLLRLHSTYRHDFKVYSSDEGRVQTSAAAFTQGLLSLEGTSLTPILASLVNKDAAMLEAFGKGASLDMRAAKEELYRRITWDPAAGVSRCKLPPAPPPPTPPSVSPTPPASPRPPSSRHQPTGAASASRGGAATSGGGSGTGMRPARSGMSAGSGQQQQQQQQERQVQLLYGSTGDLTLQASSIALAAPLKGLSVRCSSVGGSMSARADGGGIGGGGGGGGGAGLAADTAGSSGSGGGSGSVSKGETGEPPRSPAPHALVAVAAAGLQPEPQRAGTPMAEPRSADTVPDSKSSPQLQHSKQQQGQQGQSAGGCEGQARAVPYPDGTATFAPPPARQLPDQPLELLHEMVVRMRVLVAALAAHPAVAAATAAVAAAAAGSHHGLPAATATSAAAAASAASSAAGVAETSVAEVEGTAAAPVGEEGVPPAPPPTPPRHAYYSSLSMSPDEWQPVPGSPCGGERWLLLYDRWLKLLESFWSEKKHVYDISKVPDIYDAAKHALIHNAYLPLGPANQQQQQDPPASAATAATLLVGHLVAPLYLTARRLADVVVPHEYGLDPKSQLLIGSAICRELLGKLLADLAAMREESVATEGTITPTGSFGGAPPTPHMHSAAPSSTRLNDSTGGGGSSDGGGARAYQQHHHVSTATAAAAAPPAPLLRASDSGVKLIRPPPAATEPATTAAAAAAAAAGDATAVGGTAGCAGARGDKPTGAATAVVAVAEAEAAACGSTGTSGGFGGGSGQQSPFAPAAARAASVGGGGGGGTTAGPSAVDGEGGGGSTAVAAVDAARAGTASTAAGALAAEAEALVDSLASEFGTASLQDEEMQAMVRSPTGGRAAWPGRGGSGGSGGGLSGGGSGGGGLFGPASGMLGGGAASSPKRSTPPGGAAGGAVPTADGRGVTSAEAAAAKAAKAVGAAGGVHPPELWEAMEEVAAEESALGEGAAVGAGGGSGSGSGSGVHLPLTAGAVEADEGVAEAMAALLASVTADGGREPAAGGGTAAAGVVGAESLQQQQEQQQAGAVAKPPTVAIGGAGDGEGATVAAETAAKAAAEEGPTEEAAEAAAEEGPTEEAGGGPAGEEAGGGGEEDEVAGVGAEDEEVARQALHRLCPTYATDINSPLRHVRTRVYFTSESHIHALANTLRYCHLRSAAQKAATSSGGADSVTPPAASRQSSLASAPSGIAAAALDAAAFAAAMAAEAGAGGGGAGSTGGAPPVAGLLGSAGSALLDSIPEYDYMTQIVLRMFENKHVPLHSPARFRVEVWFSPGAARGALEERAAAFMAAAPHVDTAAMESAAGAVGAVGAGQELGAAGGGGGGVGGGGGGAHGSPRDPLEAERHAVPLAPLTCLNAGHDAAQSLSDMEAMLRPLAAHRKVPRDTYALQVALKVPSLQQQLLHMDAARQPSTALNGPPPPPPALVPLLGAVANALVEEAAAAAAAAAEGRSGPVGAAGGANTHTSVGASSALPVSSTAGSERSSGVGVAGVSPAGSAGSGTAGNVGVGVGGGGNGVCGVSPPSRGSSASTLAAAAAGGRLAAELAGAASLPVTVMRHSASSKARLAAAAAAAVGVQETDAGCGRGPLREAGSG